MGRICVIGALAYIALVIMLRISGTRTLSKMNSFDFIVTIALGSTLSSGILQKSTTLADVAMAFAVLIGLQFFVTKAAVKSEKFNRLVKASPVVLFENGLYLEKQMNGSNVTKDEIQAAARQAGLSEMDKVKTVVLESNGKIVATKKD